MDTSKLSLICKVNAFEFKLSDVYSDDEEWPRQMIEEVLADDILAFIEEMGGLEGFLKHCEFRWEKKHG